MDEIDDFGIILAIVFIIGALIGGIIMDFKTTSIIDTLGNAICEDTFGPGSEYSHMEGNDVICEKPKDSEVFDGLKVKLE